ncbi:MAG TPA: glycosyltransferase family 39 protein [Gaiellaceae bacterium]|nr:glycosyltransferase family 39 protein [Gaiellaceae bacterium]
MSSVAVERRALREASIVAPALALATAVAFLLSRTLPDVGGKPWHEDEAVAGLISAQPLGDLLHTVLLDRGGAPLHFLLTHMAFAVDASPQTLRWLSLVFALATIPLCYDLARRVAGPFAGATAAALAATSQLLTVYASFGRMYSLFAFASVLSLDLFVRAVDHPTRRTLIGAAVSALVPLAVHPFGVFVFAAELAVAIWLWRLRALPLALLAVPFTLPYLRLPGRFDPDAGMSAPEAALRALGGSAGGYGIGLVAFAALAAIGAWRLPRTHAALGLLLIVLPPAALAVAGSDKLSPRHLIFMLPVWTTFVAAGVARLPARGAVAAVIVLAAAIAPGAVADPRTTTPGSADAVAAPAAWLRANVHRGDVLYPYSAVFLAALPDTAVARPLPREPVALRRALGGAGDIRRVLVAIPLRRPLDRAVPGGHVFRSWLILEHRGPFATLPAQLARLAPTLRGTSAYSGLLQLRGAACGC